METRLARTAAPVYRTCRTSWSRSATKSSPLLPHFRASSTKAKPSTQPSHVIHRQTPSKFTSQFSDSSAPKPRRIHPEARIGQPPTEEEMKSVQGLSDVVLNHPSIPSEKQTIAALRAIEHIAQKIAGVSQQSDTATSTDENTPASALLSLDSRATPHVISQQHLPTETIDFLSNIAYKLMKHPTVFISPSILDLYVMVQSLLIRPSSFPEIFTLYTTKPIPTPSKSSQRITYEAQSPTAISTAIPSKLASLALNTAIQEHSLPLALSIIDTTYSTKSFHRSKMFRRALPPVVAASLAPLAAYSFAATLSAYQTALPPENFTAIAFAGILTYTTAVGTIGYVALTTSNDQMERVTWAVGLPLWERWVREDERAALDQVVLAWGFKEKWRWGEEEGAEWDGLKEWAGIRGMVVDKVGLMEGME